MDAQGIKPDPEKISTILNYVTPRCVKNVRRLLGMAGWYRRFIQNFANVVAPLTDLLKKAKGKFVWTKEASEAMEKLKILLTSEQILTNPDFSKPFIVQCDALDTGMGAILVQGEGDDDRGVYEPEVFGCAEEVSDNRARMFCRNYCHRKIPSVYRRNSFNRVNGSCLTTLASEFKRPGWKSRKMGSSTSSV